MLKITEFHWLQQNLAENLTRLSGIQQFFCGTIWEV